MKKVWLAVALAAIGVMATSVFADVQNIRLSGDVRVRGYYVNAQYYPYSEGPSRKDNAFILQRTRVTCEADLEDHVLVVITLKAEGLWGKEGYADFDSTCYDRGWEVGVSEAYVQFSEMFFTPTTLKLGRQYLHYGKGFVLSSANETYNFDAARLVLDFYPLTVDIVGAKITDRSTDGSWLPTEYHGGNNLLFVNAKYEMKDSIIKAIEAYFGWFTSAGAGGYSGDLWYYPHGGSSRGSSPWTLGLRACLAPIKGLEMWAEGAYEGGANGINSGDDGSYSGWMGNVGAKYTFKDVKMEPAINANYIYASGYSSGYVPFFPSFIGNNGYLFCPVISNIHIFNVGASIKPAQNVTLAVQGYFYMLDDTGSSAGTDWIQQEIGMDAFYGYGKREIGWEVDGILGYDYSKDVRFQLVYAVFIPDRAVKSYTYVSAAAHLVRGEVNVRF
jgi:hypothetical protein